MNEELGNLTLSQLQYLNPQAYELFELSFVDSYEDFVRIIYKTFDFIINELQQNPQYYDGFSEDQITNQVISLLRAKGFNAYSDAETGGHVDIRIDKPEKKYLWLCEAKKSNSIPHIHEGFLQLTTRYATGVINQNEGGILIYIFKKSATDFIGKYIAYLDSQDDLLIEKNKDNPLEFYSVSNIKRIGKGIDYRVRHMGISLYFSPQDKSGRTAKKYKSQS